MKLRGDIGYDGVTIPTTARKGGFNHSPDRRTANRRTSAASQVAAQQSIPVAIAYAEAATAEGVARAVIELIVKSAMVGAVRPAAEPIVGAMVAKTQWQRLRALPIHLDEGRRSGQQFNRLLGATGGSPCNAGQEKKRKDLHEHLSRKVADKCEPGNVNYNSRGAKKELPLAALVRARQQRLRAA